MRIVASVSACARVRFSKSIVCHLLGSFKWLQRPLISCEWLLSSSYDTSRRRLTGFPLSHSFCHPIFSCTGGALGDCEWLTCITDHGDQMVLLPSCFLHRWTRWPFTKRVQQLCRPACWGLETTHVQILLVYTDMSMQSVEVSIVNCQRNTDERMQITAKSRLLYICHSVKKNKIIISLFSKIEIVFVLFL